MRTEEKSLQDPTVTHRLFERITSLSDDERRTLLKLLDEGLLKGKCRRAHFRKPARLPLAYTNRRAVYQSMTKDISLGGVFISTNISFNLGEELKMLFKTQKKGSAKILGRVARISLDGVGVRFLSMNNDMKTAILSFASEV
jgi:Tfp pilus assembly protein PilZ